MIEPTEIQIFVSNPKDVDLEKHIVENVCTRINIQLSKIDCNIRYLVKEWGKIIGQFGLNAQLEIESKVGSYDLYLGIWWKKFGSNTRLINPETDEDFGSGTYREFCIAYNRWKDKKVPEIYLFFKKETSEDLFDPTVHSELGRVIDFEHSQQKNGFCNTFNDNHDFERKITDLLWTKATQLCVASKIKQKITLLNANINAEITKFQLQVSVVPQDYIVRSTTHFSLIKNRQSIPFLEVEKQSLDKLILLKFRVVLLGDAGSGKSTELRNLFHRLNFKDSPIIPIFQNLNTYTPENGIESFLPIFWKSVPRNLLLIIWDGLDEILPEHFNTVVRQITSFSSKYTDIRILISCRTNFYELPVNESPGTLVGFEPYIINDLDINDVRNYYQKKFLTTSAEIFISELFDNNLLDLTVKPFFLMLLVDNFTHNKKLSFNRAGLYEMFLSNRINLDEYHYKNSFDIRGKRNEIIQLLEKVALSMEILTRNYILESEILQLVTSDEFSTLKRCTAFKKKDGEEETWQFEHNNLQEYLAAKALVNLEFEKVIKFLTFEQYNNKLIPSWVNTLTFLFSLLKKNDILFIKLIDWMLKHERELVVKFERDKVPVYLRDEIFQGIFNYYKKLGVWISSNKFNELELARFGQSESNIRFLISEIRFEQNSKIVKLSAIRLLGHFKLEEIYTKKEVEKLLLEQIELNDTEPNYIGAIINALNWADIINKNAIKQILQLVGDRKSQYIRSAVYAILLKSSNLEDYIEYLLEGLQLYGKTNILDREDIRLVDEGWNLKECLLNLRSPDALKRLISYFSDNKEFDYWYDTDKVLKAIINNSIDVYKNDQSIYDSILIWFINETRGYNKAKSNIILTFFDKTDTRKKAFHQIWESNDDNQRTKQLAIAKLITQEIMLYIIDLYNMHNITNKQLENIYYNMSWVGNGSIELFGNLISEKTDFKIIAPQQIDYDALRQKEVKDDFDLLFDANKFRKETLRIFEGQGNEILSFDELNGIRKKNNKYIEIDEFYSAISLRLLRDFVRESGSISKNVIVKWFEGSQNQELMFRVASMYDHLTNYKYLEIKEKQAEWIVNWCKENVFKVNFRNAVEINESGGITFNMSAVYIWYFSRKLNISYPKKILLDMLSFDFFEDNEWVGIDYLIKQLQFEDITLRMVENLQIGIKADPVLKNHVKFLSQYKVKETYSLILNEILNSKRSDYHRKELLDIFFDNTKDIQSLRKLLVSADSILKWSIIDKLKVNNDESFIESFLLNELTRDINSEEKGKTAEVLVTLQNLEGLKAYVEWIKASYVNDIELIRANCLNNLKTIDAIPYLIDLLELSYIRDLKIDRFDSFNSQVIGAFFNVALVSEESFVKVKFSLDNFINDKAYINDNVKYLVQTIERMEEQFYMNRVQVYTISGVKEKLRIFQELT
jgi:GTPase SAR1 family protein